MDQPPNRDRLRLPSFEGASAVSAKRSCWASSAQPDGSQRGLLGVWACGPIRDHAVVHEPQGAWSGVSRFKKKGEGGEAFLDGLRI